MGIGTHPGSCWEKISNQNQRIRFSHMTQTQPVSQRSGVRGHDCDRLKMFVFCFFFNCANLNLVLFVRSDVFTESLSDRNYIILWAIILLINQQPSWSVNQYICCCKIFNEWTILEETVECFIQCNDDNDDDDDGVSCQRMMKMMSWTLFNRK